MRIRFPICSVESSRGRSLRLILAIFSIMLLAGSPVHAGPIAIREVVQVVGGLQNPPQLRLRSLYGAGGPVTNIIGGGRAEELVNASAGDLIDSDTLLAGVTLGTNDPQAGVEIVGQGELEGTICDCGEVMVAAGGFPKWPLIFLGAIPLFFIHDCDSCDNSTPTPTPTPPINPTPTPTPTPVPEPTSLLLLGTGLVVFGAGLRRRYSQAKQAAEEG